jgi:hypothetical protein
MTETELCQNFMMAAESYGWTCYPETSGWDILLVRDEVQIGVQAKLRANVKVVAQCLPDMYWWGRKLSPSVRRTVVKRGPRFRTVLVPRKTTAYQTLRDLSNVCQALGIWVFTDDMFGWYLLEVGSAVQPDYDWQPEKPEWLPDFVPQVPAGAASPLQLTSWKQSALRLLARAQVRGKVTSADAKEIGVHMDLFVNRYNDQWLVQTGKEGRFHTYELWPAAQLPAGSRRPDVQHPAAFEYFVEEAKKELSEESG